jgi:hypothetical protein
MRSRDRVAQDRANLATYIPQPQRCDERTARNARRCPRLFGCVRILFVPSRIAAEKHESA